MFHVPSHPFPTRRSSDHQGPSSSPTQGPVLHLVAHGALYLAFQVLRLALAFLRRAFSGHIGPAGGLSLRLFRIARRFIGQALRLVLQFTHVVHSFWRQTRTIIADRKSTRLNSSH